MVLLVLMVTLLSGTTSIEITPQLCLNGTAGGLGCRCTTSLTDMALTRCEVDCSSRNISTLPEEWQISQLVSTLDLSRNKLSSLSNEQFSHWGNLEALNLARNLFRTLNEDVFVGLANLRILDLSYNLLTTLPPKIFNGLPILSVLNLEMNSLQELDPHIFSSTPHLESLTLSYNPGLGNYLMSSPEFLLLAVKNNLTSLVLNNMGINSVPKYLFSESTNLIHLSLADNPMHLIDVLPASLESLNLSGINVEILIPGNFIYYPKLKRLHLDRLLWLREVQQNAFEGLTSLEVLTMENCIQLHEFNDFAFGGNYSTPVPLRKFSLARGGLHTLGPDTFFILKKTLKYLNLQGNPWRCDCKLSWFLRLQLILEDTGYLRCFYPEEHHNKLLLSLDPEEFVCTNKVMASDSMLMILLDVFLIVFVLVACITILVLLRRRGLLLFKPRLEVGRYAHVNVGLDPNHAEMEWDDKDLEHIRWSTSSTKGTPKGS